MLDISQGQHVGQLCTPRVMDPEEKLAGVKRRVGCIYRERLERRLAIIINSHRRGTSRRQRDRKRGSHGSPTIQDGIREATEGTTERDIFVYMTRSVMALGSVKQSPGRATNMMESKPNWRLGPAPCPPAVWCRRL